MLRWFQTSLKRKLSFLLVVSILVPLFFLGFFTYKIASMVTEEQAQQSGMNSLLLLASNLTIMIQDVENMSIFIIGQENVQRFLNHDETAPVSPTVIIGTLSNLVFMKPYISDITIIPNNGTPPLSNMTILKSGLTEALQQADKTHPSPEKFWTPLYENQTVSGIKRVVSLYRPIRNYNTFKQTANLAISIDQDAFTKLLSQFRFQAGSFVLLLDDRNQVLAGGQPEWLKRPIGELFPGMVVASEDHGIFNYGNGKAMKTVQFRTIQPVGWKIVSIVPYDEYKAENRYVLTLTAAAIAVAVLLIIGLILFFVQRVTKPLVVVTHYLKQANPDNPIPADQVTAPDEVGQLIRSYNQFGERIHQLTEQVKRNETLKKEADMRALQAQINPHFLYNTLSSIHWIALMNKDMKIAEMVGSLSDFLRFSLNRGQEFCTVHQEVAHAQHYANIQSIRFPDKFELRFFVDPELRERMMLKLLLQPLIENSLIHGIQKRSGKGSIDINIHAKDGSMKVVVEDDGVGIPEGRLYEIRGKLNDPEEQAPPANGSYGLRNVHQRLRLHYGENSGLTITSVEGKGTRIEFLIPISEGAKA